MAHGRGLPRGGAAQAVTRPGEQPDEAQAVWAGGETAPQTPAGVSPREASSLSPAWHRGKESAAPPLVCIFTPGEGRHRFGVGLGTPGCLSQILHNGTPQTDTGLPFSPKLVLSWKPRNDRFISSLAPSTFHKRLSCSSHTAALQLSAAVKESEAGLWRPRRAAAQCVSCRVVGAERSSQRWRWKLPTGQAGSSHQVAND